jgi:hypothetical protein
MAQAFEEFYGSPSLLMLFLKIKNIQVTWSLIPQQQSSSGEQPRNSNEFYSHRRLRMFKPI